LVPSYGRVLNQWELMNKTNFQVTVLTFYLQTVSWWSLLHQSSEQNE